MIQGPIIILANVNIEANKICTIQTHLLAYFKVIHTCLKYCADKLASYIVINHDTNWCDLLTHSLLQNNFLKILVIIFLIPYIIIKLFHCLKFVEYFFLFKIFTHLIHHIVSNYFLIKTDQSK